MTAVSSPQPASKEQRPDTSRQAPAQRQAPERSGGATSAGAMEANGAAGDAAAARMADSPHEGKWMSLAHSVEGGALILKELVASGHFHPISGEYEGTIDLAKALRYASLISAAHAYTSAVTLGAASAGGNMVHVKLNLYHKVADVSASQLLLASVNYNGVSAKTSEIRGLVAHYDANSVEASFAAVNLHDVTFHKGEQVLRAREVAMQQCAAGAHGGTTGSLRFAEAHVHGLLYPNAAPLDIDLPGGTSLDAVWAQQTGPKPASGSNGALPTAPNVLPAGASVKIELAGLHAGANLAGDAAHGGGGFEHLRLALVKDGKDLAALTITGFKASGSATAAGATIGRVELKGAPPLMEALLANQQLASEPHVANAVGMVKQLGLKPSIDGTVAFANISLAHGPGGDSALGDFSSSVHLPGIGTLNFNMSKFSIGTAGGAAGSFQSFDATLLDEAKKEVGHVALAGADAKTTAAGRTAGVKKLSAGGNVNGIIHAVEPILKSLPVTVRSGFEMVRALGISGDVTGSVSSTTKDGKTEFGGSFTAHLSAGGIGDISINVQDFHGSDTAASATFRHFDAQLTTKAGKAVAGVGIANAAFTAGKTKSSNAFHAGAIDVRGDATNLGALIHSIEQQAPGLPPPVRVAFGMIRSYVSQGGGTLQLADVNVANAGSGHETGRLGAVHAGFTLPTGEAIQINLSALAGGRAGGGTKVDFERFDATLTSPKASSKALVVVEKGGATIGAKPAAGVETDYALHAHHIVFDGVVTNISKLLTAIRERLGELPAPISRAFEVVGELAAAQGPNAGAASTVDATDLNIHRGPKEATASGNIAVSVGLRDGTAAVSVRGFSGKGEAFAVEALDVTVAEASGGTAAKLHGDQISRDDAGKITVGALTAEGDAARLRAVVSQVAGKLPETIEKALGALGESRIDAAISSISVTPTAAGGMVTDAALIKVNGAIAVNDAAGNTYRSPNAAIGIYGAHVTLSPDKKPQQVHADRLELSGNFASTGAGRALSGQATLHTGAATILFDAAGGVKSVDAHGITASGGGALTQAPAAKDAAPAAPAGPAPSPADAAEQKLAMLDKAGPAATEAAAMLKGADIHAHTPIQAGRYGSGIVNVEVPTGAMIHTSLQVRDYALTNGTRVDIQPKLGNWLVKLGGAELETNGTQGALKVNLGGLFGGLATFFGLNNVSRLTGKKVTLNLAALVTEVMSSVRTGLEKTAAQAGEPVVKDPRAEAKASAQTARDKRELAEKQRKWNASHGDAKSQTEDAASQPRTSSITGLAEGIQIAATTGDAALDLEAKDGNVEAHLQGQATGGLMQFGASDATIRDLGGAVGGGTAKLHNASSGAVTVAKQGDTSTVSLAGLSIEQMSWSK
jgi:hypothetical protein